MYYNVFDNLYICIHNMNLELRCQINGVKVKSCKKNSNYQVNYKPSSKLFSISKYTYRVGMPCPLLVQSHYVNCCESLFTGVFLFPLHWDELQYRDGYLYPLNRYDTIIDTWESIRYLFQYSFRYFLLAVLCYCGESFCIK